MLFFPDDSSKAATYISSFLSRSQNAVLFILQCLKETNFIIFFWDSYVKTELILNDLKVPECVWMSG